MKFSITKSELQNALSVVLKGASTRSTLPVLSGIYIEAGADALILQATDLELSIQYKVTALIEEEGKAVFPGKLFSDIVKNLPDAAVHVETDDNVASIACDSSSFSIKTLSSDDFPGFPTVDTQQLIELPFNLFASMIKKVARVVSKDESRAVLTGVLITCEENKLRMVATDSYRLAVTEAEYSDTEGDGFQAVISGTFLLEIAALPKTSSSVKVGLAENQIVITCEDTVFINRRIEGNFPNYKQLLPETFATRAKLNVEYFAAGVRRVSLLGSSSSPVKLDLNTASQTLQVSATTQDVGSAQETIACEIEGEDVEIAFNYAYILDGLGGIEGEEIYFETQSSLKPGILRAVSDEENYLYLIMPVRIS